MIKLCSNPYNNSKLKSIHKQASSKDNDRFDTLFSNSKLAEKKRSFVNLIKEKPGHNKKYSNTKSYDSIPLLHNIKRYLSIDVVRQTKNSKYQLIIKKQPQKQPIKHQRTVKTASYTYQNHSQLKNKQKRDPFDDFQNNHTYLNKFAYNTNGFQTRKSFLYQSETQRQIMSSFTNRKLSNAFKIQKNYQNQQLYIDSQRNLSPIKIKAKSNFLIQGLNLSPHTSNVWILNNES